MTNHVFVYSDVLVDQQLTTTRRNNGDLKRNHSFPTETGLIKLPSVGVADSSLLRPWIAEKACGIRQIYKACPCTCFALDQIIPYRKTTLTTHTIRTHSLTQTTCHSHPIKMVTVAIAGGTGNLGRALVETLIAKKGIKVIVLARTVSQCLGPRRVHIAQLAGQPGEGERDWSSGDPC